MATIVLSPQYGYILLASALSMLIQDIQDITPATLSRRESSQSISVEQFELPSRSTNKRFTGQNRRIEMGCIASRPIRAFKKFTSLIIRGIIRLGARLSEIFSWLKSCIFSRPVKTYPTLSEPGPHVPVEVSPVVNYLWGDQIERYDSAMAEMSLPKSERMRRQSAPEEFTPSNANSSMPAVSGDSGERLDLTGDPFLFL